MNKKAIVIGSGFGGIAISLRLKKLGYDTTIDLNEDYIELKEGQHILNHDIQETTKGTIVNLDSIEPVDYFAGVPIYKTRENILISVGNIL